MRWDSYTIWSVISGVVLVGAAAWPELSIEARLKLVAGGVLTGGWGLYAASQTSGIFLFSPLIFMIPIGVVGWVLWSARDRAIRAQVPRLSDPRVEGRRCLRCKERYPISVPGPCPACRGTLAFDAAITEPDPQHYGEAHGKAS